MTSGLSFPHHFYQLPQGPNTSVASTIAGHKAKWWYLLSIWSRSSKEKWEFGSKTEAVWQPQEDKLNISFFF